MSELKLCPCCGNKPEISETEGCDFVISCDYCGISMSDDMHWNIENYDAKQNVIDKWNTRTPDNEALLAQVEELHDSLEHLVNVKAHKDEFGKDAFYQSSQPRAWTEAKRLMQQPPQQSLDSLKSRIEEETISRAIEFLDDSACEHSGKLYSLDRKYQTTELLEK
jgi:hypothetical protein